MIDEDLLSDLMAREAERRPDADPVLDAVHQRIRRRRLTPRHAASALGAAAAVAAIAVGVTAVAAPSGHHDEPVAGSPSSAPATSMPPSSTSPTTAPTTPPTTSSAPPAETSSAPATRSPSSSAPNAAGPEPGRSYSTIDAGWLPGPATQDPDGTSNRPGFEERDWDVTVDGVAMDVIIWTESGSLPTRMQATGGKPDYRRITVNGHPGREFVSADVTIVAFDLGNGTIAYTGPSVMHTTATVTSSRIAAIAVHVAQSMQFEQHDPIPGR